MEQVIMNTPVNVIRWGSLLLGVSLLVLIHLAKEQYQDWKYACKLRDQARGLQLACIERKTLLESVARDASLGRMKATLVQLGNLKVRVKSMDDIEDPVLMSHQEGLLSCLYMDAMMVKKLGLRLEDNTVGNAGAEVKAYIHSSTTPVILKEAIDSFRDQLAA